MTNLFLIILILLQTTTGQILLKKASLIRDDKNRYWIYLFFGYTLFFFTIILSYILMQKISMKYFTVIMSLNYITILFGTHLFLNEKPTKKIYIGTCIVMLGIAIFMYR